MKILKYVSIFLYISILSIGCGGGDRTVSGTTPVTIKIVEGTQGTGSGVDQLSGSVKTRDLASAVADGEVEGRQLSLCRFIITGAGMTAMVRDVDITGKTSISETFNIPRGVNRKIIIQMYLENDDKVLFQASREGINLGNDPVELEMNLEATAEYFQPPAFEGVMSVSNAESRSVKLTWKPAADNITQHERIQYLVYLSTDSIAGRDDMEGEFIKTYSLGKGSVLEGDPLMSYEYNGDEVLLISYEYEGTLPSEEDVIKKVDQGASTGRLEPGMPYYFIVKAKDEWGHVEGNYNESEEIVVHILDVEVQGNGTVTSDPKGINCGAKCSEDYLRGTEVTLTAEADEGGAFEGWTGNEQCGEKEDCTVIPDEHTPTITAKFCQSIRYYHDTDGDGYGNSATYIDSCTQPDQDSYVDNDDDCDDSNRAINPSAKEICGNDIDENCDGIAEKECDCNDGDTRTCGTDTGECVSGIESCVNREWSGECIGDIEPVPEECDGKDNDCNGQVDDGFGDTPTSCGKGACGSTGVMQCVNSVIVDTCVPGSPSAEVCDGIDNDCNGEIDDGIAEVPTTCGDSECGSTGVLQCVNGAIVDTCVPGSPSAEVCDGVDNDCNGEIDDGIADEPITCGLGACETNGVKQCINEKLIESCTPGDPSNEVCDGNDNDCDGLIDSDDPDCDSSISEICNDGIDNDNDGKTDCADTGDCGNDPVCQVNCSEYTTKKICNAQPSCTWINNNKICVNI